MTTTCLPGCGSHRTIQRRARNRLEVGPDDVITVNDPKRFIGRIIPQLHATGTYAFVYCVGLTSAKETIGHPFVVTSV
ncbi:MAG: hypothetical protein WBZ01_21830 [Terriglobales bacterium]